MQAAGDASSAAHLKVMSEAKAGMVEWQLQDLFYGEIRRWGLRDLSFPTISASGAGGAVLHYTRDDGVLADGQLLLLDAGGEWLGYAADITRTWPVSGRFSELQKELYGLVLLAQAEATALAKPGVWISDLQSKVIEVLVKGLREFGLFNGRSEELIEKEAVKLVYPHGCSHQLGLDVHDVSPPMKKGNGKSPVCAPTKSSEKGW